MLQHAATCFWGRALLKAAGHGLEKCACGKGREALRSGAAPVAQRTSRLQAGMRRTRLRLLSSWPLHTVDVAILAADLCALLSRCADGAAVTVTPLSDRL